MEFLKFTEGEHEISPINSNLVISKKTKECLCMVLSGKYNGICFPESRAEKHENARLFSRAGKMYNFLKDFYKTIHKFAIEDVDFDENHTIGEMIEELLKR